MREPGPKPSEGPERRSERRAVTMAGHVLREGGVTVTIELTDLNYGGCGIRTPVELAIGEAVRLSVLGRGSIAAEVRWCEDDRAGLVFESLPEEAKKQIERSVARLSVPGEVGLRAVGRNAYRVGIRDLSTKGCKVDLVERPNVGDTMMVKFDGLDVLDAEVCWVEGHTAGLKFANGIHPAVLELLVQRLEA
jgi:hypothetical protein